MVFSLDDSLREFRITWAQTIAVLLRVARAVNLPASVISCAEEGFVAELVVVCAVVDVDASVASVEFIVKFPETRNRGYL